MSLTKGALKEKLKQQKTVYGTCITANPPRWPKLVAEANLDFVFLDTEHIALDRSELSQMCNTYQALGLTPIVRIPKPDPFLASMAIDAGAVGVIAPYLEQEKEIKDLVGATKYRPLKGEKLEEFLSGKKQPDEKLQKYFDKYNEGLLCIVNIESIPAVEKLDTLLTIPGVDAVFIGPHDLSINMGIPEQYDHPDFIRMVRLIIEKARKHTLGVGIHFSIEPERQLFWIKEGVNIVVHSSDMALFSQRLKADMALLKSIDSNQQPGDDTSSSVTI